MLYSPIENIPYNENLSGHQSHELCLVTKNTSEELLSYFAEHSQTMKNAMPLALKAETESISRFFIHLEGVPN